MRRIRVVEAAARVGLWLAVGVPLVLLDCATSAIAGWEEDVGAATASAPGSEGVDEALDTAGASDASPRSDAARRDGSEVTPSSKTAPADHAGSERPAPSAPPPPSTASGAAAGEQEKSQDYYSRRAAETLKKDEEGQSLGPHPLAAAYPDYDVVVCEAGCAAGRGAQIVFMERHGSRSAEKDAVMVPTSSGSAQATKAGGEAPEPECVGGCYQTGPRQQAVSSASVEGGWVTTVTQDHGRAKPAARSATDHTTKPATGESGGWLSRINRERAPGTAAQR